MANKRVQTTLYSAPDLPRMRLNETTSAFGRWENGLINYQLKSSNLDQSVDDALTRLTVCRSGNGSFSRGLLPETRNAEICQGLKVTINTNAID